MAALCLLAAACQPTRVYRGRQACQLVSNQDIAAIFNVPFDKGEHSGNLNFDEDYIGSTCTYDSTGKWKPNQPKFRVWITVEYAPPQERSLAKKRAAWEKERYNNTPFYTGIRVIPEIADGALGALDYNKCYEIWCIVKPSTKVQVMVEGVVAEELAAVTEQVALKAVAAVKAEAAPPPAPRQ